MKDSYSILKDRFVEGVTLEQAARVGGVTVKRLPHWASRGKQLDNVLRVVYALETDKNPDPKFTDGLGRMQWEYGVRGTSYYAKDKRQAVLAYMGAVS